MRIGIPAEVMNRESRVAATPATVSSWVQDGHEVLFQASAGAGVDFSDEEYQEAGANVVASAQEAWESADLILKIKEPLEEEYKYLHKDLVLFTYLHLAASKTLTQALMD